VEDNFGTLDFAEWQKVFRTNIFGPAKMADAFIDHVARGGEKLAVTVAPVSKTPARSSSTMAARILGKVRHNKTSHGGNSFPM